MISHFLGWSNIICLYSRPIYLFFKKKPSALWEQDSEKKHEENLWEKVPEEFREMTFDDIIRNRIELEYFRKFLEQNYVK